ncbi:esterase/lipase family protein [Vannielia sp. SX4]|uniref:esterase/lipase family protein n=1 Tax=Vannielia sp. SX4 TaxID=3463852 RepID=UPI004058AA8C
MPLFMQRPDLGGLTMTTASEEFEVFGLKRLLFFLAFLVVSLAPSQTKAIETVRVSGSDRLVILIHGFNSSKETAFYNEAEDDYLYDKLLTNRQGDRTRHVSDIPEYDIALAEYPADFCSAYTLSEVVRYVSNDIEASAIFRKYRYIVFVGHSLGGLVAKKVILDLNDDARSRVSGVVLLGTPSEGNVLADRATELPFFNKGCHLLSDLRSIGSNSILQDIRERWTEIIIGGKFGTRPSVHCAYERLPLRVGLFTDVVVVPQERIDTACDSIHPASADHYSISSFPDRSVDLAWLRNSIYQSFFNAAFYSNAPQVGVGEISILTRAAAYVEAEYTVQNEKASSSLDGSRASAEILADHVQQCAFPIEVAHRPVVASSIEAHRIGRTEFEIVYEGVVYEFDDPTKAALTCDDRVEVGWATNAMLMGTIAVGASDEVIRIEFVRMPGFSVELQAEDGRIAGQFSDIGGIPSIEREGFGFSGYLEFTDVLPGLYIIRIESFSFQERRVVDEWRENRGRVSDSGRVSVEIR